LDEMVVVPIDVLIAVKMIPRQVMEECQEEGIAFDRTIQIGIMIEVPSAALMASVLRVVVWESK
jgi:phosphoenolpyruvate-protein kinase (PTS system EI component)